LLSLPIGSSRRDTTSISKAYATRHNIRLRERLFLSLFGGAAMYMIMIDTDGSNYSERTLDRVCRDAEAAYTIFTSRYYTVVTVAALDLYDVQALVVTLTDALKLKYPATFYKLDQMSIHD
jgi:hypothetical protein